MSPRKRSFRARVAARPEARYPEGQTRSRRELLALLGKTTAGLALAPLLARCGDRAVGGDEAGTGADPETTMGTPDGWPAPADTGWAPWDATGGVPDTSLAPRDAGPPDYHGGTSDIPGDVWNGPEGLPPGMDVAPLPAADQGLAPAPDAALDRGSPGPGDDGWREG